MKAFYKVIKSFLVAPFVIYLYNLIAVSFDLVIPINFFSIMFVGLFGMSGLITVVLLFVFM